MIHQGKYDAAMQEVNDLLPKTVVYAQDGRIMKKHLSRLEDPPQQVSSTIDVTQCPEVGDSLVNALVTDFADADRTLYLYEGPGPDGLCFTEADNRVRMVRLSDDTTSGAPAIVPSLFPEAAFFDLGVGALTGILAVREDLLPTVPLRQLNLYDADYANPILVRDFTSEVRTLTATATAAFLVIDDRQFIRVDAEAHPNSGGLAVALPPGFRASPGRGWDATLSFDLPIHTDLDGTQVSPRWGLLASIGRTF